VLAGRGVFGVPAVLAAGGLAAIAAVAYNPNPVHLATILPVVLLVAAESVELGLTHIERRRWAALRWVTIALLVAFVVQAVHFPSCRRRFAPAPVESAFGWLDGGPGADRDLASLRAALDNTSQVAFVYPVCPELYLMAGLKNPTRFQALVPGADPLDHFQEAADSLRDRVVPFVLLCWVSYGRLPNDPVL